MTDEGMLAESEMVDESLNIKAEFSNKGISLEPK